MELEIRVAPELRFFLAPRHRKGELRVPLDETSSLGHLVESVGVPLPEVGSLLVGDRPVTPSYRPVPGDAVSVLGVRRPQEVPVWRFLLDVHLGTLARRLRLVGVDTAYHTDRDDHLLVEQANDEQRILLTRDRGLLRRRALWLGAYVRSCSPDEQFQEILDRFAPPLAPWTRCTACNGTLSPASKGEVETSLLPGTQRNYDTFARCLSCDHVYWRGAHHPHLETIVETARAAG